MQASGRYARWRAWRAGYFKKPSTNNWLKKLAKLHRNHYAVNDKCHALLMTKGCRQSTPEEAPFRSTFAPSIERHSHLRESSFHRPQEIGKQTNKHKAINTIQHNLPNTLHV